MKEKLVRVHLRSVTMPSLQTGPLAFLSDAFSGKSVQISIGAFEASAIIMRMEGLNAVRPYTHSLMASIMREQKLFIESVEIYGTGGDSEDAFFARLHYRRGWRRWTRELRVSDAMALAIETDTPMFIHPALLESTPLARHQEYRDRDQYIWNTDEGSHQQHKEAQ